MLFHTLDFAIFFLPLFAVCVFAGPRTRKFALLAGSLFFYGYWNWRILVLLCGTVAINYACALRIERGDRRKVWLAAAVSADLLLLGFFKYFNFFIESLNALLHAAGFTNGSIATLQILLPVGISFYTFELISYSVDVYRGMPAERKFPDLLLFATFFPKMMAGPIARAGQLLPLLKTPPQPVPSQIRSGATLAFFGLFKKLVVADNLALEVNRLTGNHQAPMSLLDIGKHSVGDGASMILAGSLFAMQIYADFSGYSDMARGMARMLGIELVPNFDHPFRSSNPAEFWRRWHITLGAFLRDYVYIPLGGNRAGILTQVRNLIIVWTLGGLWHGASIGYVTWGFYCGVYLGGYVLLRHWMTPIPAPERAMRVLRVLGVMATFLSFGIGLMIFRLGSASEVWKTLSHWEFPEIHPWSAAFVLPVIASHFLKSSTEEWFVRLPSWGKFTCLSIMFYILIMAGRFAGDEFFYFQF